MFNDPLFWKQLFTQFHFIRPSWLLIFLPLSYIIYLRWSKDNKGTTEQNLPPHLKKALTVGESGWKKQLPLKLLSIMTALTVIICAGPTWQREASPFGEDKAPLLILLDSSDSMLQKDVPPSRLARAKQKIADLLELRNGGRTGLIVYAGSAHLAIPLTQDTKVFTPFLAVIEPKIMPRQGKFADKTIPLVEQQFSQSETTGSVLLISDAVNQQDIDTFAEYFDRNNHQLLVLAMGDEERSSELPMNYTSLKSLTDKSNGSITRQSIDTSDITWLDRQIERHMQLSNDLAMPWQDMGYYLIFPVALVLLLWFRRGWLVQWCLLLVVSGVSLSYSERVHAELVHTKADIVTESTSISTLNKLTQFWMDLWLTPDQQGQWYFNKEEYSKAAQNYQDPIRKGVAFFYAQQYQLAQTAFMQVDTNTARFNAANALVGQREYVAARDMYQFLLDQDPDNRNAQHNLDIVQAVIDYINDFSQGQADSAEGSQEQSTELPDDEPQTADGVEEEVMADKMKSETLSAEDILASQEVADKWLKRVEANPAQFLQVKFQIQLLAQDLKPIQPSTEQGTPND